MYNIKLPHIYFLDINLLKKKIQIINFQIQTVKNIKFGFEKSIFNANLIDFWHNQKKLFFINFDRILHVLSCNEIPVSPVFSNIFKPWSFQAKKIDKKRQVAKMPINFTEITITYSHRKIEKLYAQWKKALDWEQIFPLVW